jgi:hypothetical protein
VAERNRPNQFLRLNQPAIKTARIHTIFECRQPNLF